MFRSRNDNGQLLGVSVDGLLDALAQIGEFHVKVLSQLRTVLLTIFPYLDEESKTQCQD